MKPMKLIADSETRTLFYNEYPMGYEHEGESEMKKRY